MIERQKGDDDAIDVFPSIASSIEPACTPSLAARLAGDAAPDLSPHRGAAGTAQPGHRRAHLVADQQNLGLPGAVERNLAAGGHRRDCVCGYYLDRASLALPAPRAAR
ncbi:MAG: hypothetical protein ACRDIV_17955 [Ktedonobacteraceae bacterium]